MQDSPVSFSQSFPIVRDSLHRPLHDLRISVTDRCNFRCTYCMPKSRYGPVQPLTRSNTNTETTTQYPIQFLPRAEILSFEEITQLAQAFVACGVNKLRITGGEPLLRKNLPELIAKLATLRSPNGQPLDLTLTTNGSLLSRFAKQLKEAGLTRLTISLDALDDQIFRRMNDVDFAVADVLDGIVSAQSAGFEHIKINMVVQRGVNDAQIIPMAKHFRGTSHVVRFIEYMDVGNSNGWQPQHVLPSQAVLAQLQQYSQLISLQPNYVGEVAERWAYADGTGEIGLISSVSQPFCRACTRARLSTEGKLYTCLFAQQGADLRRLLREKNLTTPELAAQIQTVWQQRADRYSELRGSAIQPATPQQKKIEMSYIGG